MSDFDDDQERAEQFDDDSLDRAGFPPDDPMGVIELLDKDAPVGGEYATDSLADRIAREQPELTPAGYDMSGDLPGGIIDPSDPYEPDTIAAFVGEEGEVDDDYGGVVLSDSARSEHDSDTWPAEEAALHVIENPADMVDLLEVPAAEAVIDLDATDERLKR